MVVPDLIDAYDAVLLDLDGVLFRGERALPGAAATIDEVRRRGVRVAFMTNNATRTPAEVVELLAGFGVGAAVEEVETSSTAATAEIVTRGYRRVVAIGQAGLLEVLAEAGVQVVGPEERPDAVVIGGDFTFSYEKLRDATVAARTGIPLLATNADPTYPVADGALWPGAGAIVAAVEVASDREAEVVGKPQPPMYLAAARRADSSRPIVVGDRIDTDIAGAVALGWDSLLVLSGVTTRDDLATSSIRPTYVGGDVSALLAPAQPA